MPEPAIVLDQDDQADDLRELIALTAILQEWLEYAGDGILDDLASSPTATPSTHAATRTGSPRDLAALSGRLRKAASCP